MEGVRLFLLLFGIVGVSSYSKLPTSYVNAGSQPVSPSNAFLGNPVLDQLPLWAEVHPGGARVRATNSAGIPMPSLTASLSIGAKGPILLDPFLLDSLASFNRQRIPERAMGAKGQGAFGHFVVTQDVSRYTKAKFLNSVGKVTPILARFSGLWGRSGWAETRPQNRGFSLKFYTEDGNHDLVGMSAEVFAIRDPMLFPSYVKSLRDNPATGVDDRTQRLDFTSIRCERVHAVVRFLRDSNRHPRSKRALNGSAVNTFKCINAQGVPSYCRFHWRSWQDMDPLGDEETIQLAGSDPYYYTRDLYNAIGREEYPKWTLGLQVMTYSQAKELEFNPFDPTKVWRFEDFPFITAGVLALTGNPTDYFTQIEEAAFDPGNMVPGIEPSPDKILAARLFAYKDAQRYRLGPNYALIEVNKPKCPVSSYDRDGGMRLSPSENGDGGPIYFPNNFEGSRVDPSASQLPYPVAGDVDRADSGDEDNFSQAREFLFRDIGTAERVRIARRVAATSIGAQVEARNRYILNCHYPIGKEWGDLVVAAMQEALQQQIQQSIE